MSLRADRRQVQLAPAAGRRGTRAATRIWPDASYPHRAALDRGQFKSMGGFGRMNKVFDGRLEEVLGELSEALWEETG